MIQILHISMYKDLHVVVTGSFALDLLKLTLFYIPCSFLAIRFTLYIPFRKIS